MGLMAKMTRHRTMTSHGRATMAAAAASTRM